jgi:hypothetical protein
MSVSLFAYAQDAPTVEGKTVEESEAATGGSDDLATRMADMEKMFEEQQARIDVQDATITRLENENKEKPTVVYEGEELEKIEVSTTELFKIYGFFDLGFYKAFYEEDSLYDLFLNESSTFVVTNLNVYLASQMTETLSALVELRFSFLPVGESTSAQVVHIGDTELQITEYERLDTTVWDSSTLMEFRQGGVNIERVHLNYEPLDWLNFLGGRFLTPYGIWNVDHASTVIMTVRSPYMVTRQMVPAAQTGIQIYGRLYPRYDLFFDYAVTLSNGRGAMDEVMDLDENKAVGLRLRFSYESDNINISLGGYGYVGEVSDVTKTGHMVLKEDDMTLDEDVETPIWFEVTSVGKYMEYITSADLLMEFWGVGLQSEFIWRYIDMEAPGVRDPDNNLFSGAPADLPLYTPTNSGIGYYALLYWELPLHRWISPVKITPYVMYEDTKDDDTTTFTTFQFLLAGLNVKPSPFVTLKGEYFRAIPESELFGESISGMYFQMAVTF